MALHGFHGSRSMRHLEAERKTARPPANASKTLSATTASSPASRIPAYTSSWFSRGKPGRGEALTSSAKDTTSSTGSVRKENRLEEPRASRIEPLRHVLPHSTPNLGLGISATRSLSDTRIRPSQIDQRNKLKPQSSSNNQRSQYALSESSSSSYDPTPPRASRADVGSPSGFSDPFPGSILGITVPSIPAPTSYLPRLSPLNPEQSTSSTRMANYTSRQEPRKLSTLDLPPPTPNFAHSSGSSTRYSDSPGPFSRESTPTSASSQSPGITQPSKLPARTRQPSPTRSRPPVTKRRIGGTPRFDETVSTENQGLPPLRESVTSSSSSSTIKGVERTEGNKIRPTRNIVSPPPPNPSLRRLSKKSSGSFLDQGFQPKSGPRESYVEPDPRENITLQHSRPVAPPPRPSREGTPTLDARNRPSPVIQSNLSRLVTTGHKRRESLDKSLTSLDARTEGTRMDRPTLGRSSSISSTSSSVRPSRLPSPIANTVALLRSPSKEPPSLQIDVGRGPIKREASPLSASTPTTRFGLFSRRTQSPLEIAPSDNGQKSTKKGPAAGTGHEGYGRYARRGRSGSASTSAGRGRSTSTGNTSIRAARSSSSRKSSTSQGEPEMDDFLLDRLTPVILTGGGSADGSFSGMDMYRTSSEESSPGIRSMDEIKPKATLVSADPGCLAVNSEPKIKNSMFPLKAHRSLPRAQKDLEHKESSDSSNFRRSSRVPTLAARRSLHQPELSRDSEPMAMPTRINDRVLARSPALDRRDMVQPSIAQTDSKVLPTDDISEGHEGNWLKAKKLDKRPRSPKKWNFFQRSHASPQNQVDDKRRNQQASAKELPAMISRLPDSRSVAHYAMLDSDEPSTLDTVEDLMQDVEDILEFQETGDVGPITKNAKKAEHREHKYSMLLPPPPIFEKQPPNEEAKASLGRPLHQPGDKISDSEPSTTVSKVKQSRLAQVGRIPRVVSKRDHPHKPPPHSFSRPFTRVPVPLDQTPTNITEPEEIVNTQQPTFGVQADVIPSEPWADYNFNQSSNPSLGSNRIFNPTSAEEFFQFPPRKASEVSASSSSGIISIAAITAILPNPDAALSEDEVWTEYDELLDNVESPKVHIAQLAKKHQMSGQTQHKSNMADARAPAPLNIRKKSSDNGSDSSPRRIVYESPQRTKAPVYRLPSPPISSRQLPSYQAVDEPSATLSFTEIIVGYGDRDSGGVDVKRTSTSSGSQYSSKSPRRNIISQIGESSESQNKHTQIMAQKTSSIPGLQSNLRFGALMTSRWLSFGRVLFSPAHTEIKNNRQDRVLVLDGLGNDDWSFYCALTYPDATVYSLSSVQSKITSLTKNRELEAYQSPSNHRQIHHASITHPFPFPKGFFTAVIFRFPVVSSEAVYQYAISECKRVLRPGGYLEMSVLDLDMVKMGNRARRAIRDLKVRMQIADPQVSLKPVSDNIQKMLGRRGFENLNRCMLEVPVAGRISNSRAGSFDEKDLSLGDMLRDRSQQGDEDITKMVAKVGRWWYSRCYEMSVLPDEDLEKSIWADKALLRECVKWETGFKLLICYAQKPLAPRRRTVSV